MNRQDELKAAYGETALQDAAVRAEYEAYVWEHLVDRGVALRAMGAEYGLDVTKGDIAESVDAAVAQIIETEYDGDVDAYVAMLDQVYTTVPLSVRHRFGTLESTYKFWHIKERHHLIVRTVFMAFIHLYLESLVVHSHKQFTTRRWPTTRCWKR